MSCHASASSVTHSLRPPMKDHPSFGNCFSAILQFPKIAFVFHPGIGESVVRWHDALGFGNWDLGIGMMMDVPSATFVIRSFSSVRQSARHTTSLHLLSVVLFPFTNHDVASRRACLSMCVRVFGGTRQFSWLFAALAFMCGCSDFGRNKLIF